MFAHMEGVCEINVHFSSNRCRGVSHLGKHEITATALYVANSFPSSAVHSRRHGGRMRYAPTLVCSKHGYNDPKRGRKRNVCGEHGDETQFCRAAILRLHLPYYILQLREHGGRMQYAPTVYGENRLGASRICQRYFLLHKRRLSTDVSVLASIHISRRYPHVDKCQSGCTLVWCTLIWLKSIMDWLNAIQNCRT